MKPSRSPFAFLALLVTVAALEACSVNPLQVAETPAQRAYALERAYNIVLENAVTIVENPATPEGLRERIRDVEASTTPLIDALSNAFASYEYARAEFELGESTEERLAIAAASLEEWLTRAEQALIELSRAIRSE